MISAPNQEKLPDRWPRWLWRQVKVTLTTISWSRKWRGFESHSVHYVFFLIFFGVGRGKWGDVFEDATFYPGRTRDFLYRCDDDML